MIRLMNLTRNPRRAHGDRVVVFECRAIDGIWRWLYHARRRNRVVRGRKWIEDEMAPATIGYRWGAWS